MPHEYQEVQDMMRSAELIACQTYGGHFTWSNRHEDGLIYSKKFHVLGNQAWFQKYGECRVEVLAPHISDRFIMPYTC